MSLINKLALISWTDVSTLEDKINKQFIKSHDIDINDILIFAKISPYSFYPLESTIDDKGQIKIKNSSDYIGLELYIGSKQQFFHKRLILSQDTYKLELDEYFKTAWNPEKFIVFQDGYLMNHGLFTYIIPSFDNNYLRKYIYSTSKFKKNSRIDIYYIESDDNFNSLPISRDLYLGAIQYIARKNNEKIIPIPYPFKNRKSSFFVFNEQGEYLDNGTDYIVSYDEFYITLRKPLPLATVDYIIFAFPIISKEKELVEPTEIFGPLSGSPYFKYSYSVPSTYNTTGLVRFSPIYDEYVLTKKNFLLFGNGEWIHPNRFEVHSNDAILFNNRQDQEICANINYTMVIFEDNTDHTAFSLPRDFFIVKLHNKEPNQKVFKVENNIPFKYKSFAVFKHNQLITDYDFDEDSEKIYFKDPINEDLYLICFSTQVNNTNQDILVYTTSFNSEPNGTSIPEEYVLNNLNNSWVLIFLDGVLLNPDQYTIRNKKLYLNASLQGSVISMLLLISGFKKDPIKRTDQQIQMIQQWQENIDYNLQETAYFYIRSSARSTERGVILLLDQFDGYKLNKRNMLLFNAGGIWIDPQRFDVVDNNKLYLVSPYDHERSLYTSTYYAVTFDDKLTDEKYSPPNVLVVHVKADKDYQDIFEIPTVHRRFRSFLLFKGSLLLNREYNYVIEDETHIKLTNPLDYLRKGRSIAFVFLDAYSRFGQENLFIQSSFECKVNQVTPLPSNFLHKRFNTDNIAIFLNGLFMSPDKYKIVNNSILLDGFIDVESLSTRIFTLLYMTTIPINLRHYDYFIPPYPDIPIKENDIIPSVYFSRRYITTRSGRITDVSPSFTDYTLGKQNFLLFGDRHWIHPENYQLYSNDKLIWKIDNLFSNIEMIIFNDSLVRTDDINIPSSIKTIDVDIDGNSIDIPLLGEQYKSFIIFDKNTGKLIETTIDNKHDEIENKIIFSSILHTTLTFVFLRSYMTTIQQLLFYQYSFLYENNYKMPLNIFTKDTVLQYLLIFQNGEYLRADEYNIDNGSFTPTDSMLYNTLRFDYSTSIEVINKNKTGKISFNNPFTHYTLTKNNFLLFGNGTWIHPTRFEINNNSQIVFTNLTDKEHADYVNYTMIIPTNDTEITLNIHTFTATQDRQKVFTLPYKFDSYTTFLVFKAGLLVPNERVYIEDNRCMFKSNTEYLDTGRSFSIVTIDTSKSTWAAPAFKQKSFIDTNANHNNGIDIPTSFYEYENMLILFIGGRYIDPTLYRIDNHKLYLIEEDMYTSSKSYTFLTIEKLIKRSKVSLVYLLSLVPDTEDHYDQYVVTRPDYGVIDRFKFSYSYSQPIINKTNSGNVTFSPAFTQYALEKNNFLLFGNGTWIHPDRFSLSSNIKLTFNNLPDKQHSDYVNYTMIIPNEGNISATEPVTINLHQLTATQDQQRVFDLPELTPYSTFLVFIGGLLVPNNDRIIINNNQIIFKNNNDYLEKGRSLDLVILDDSSTKDRRYPTFVQDTFPSNPDLTKGTVIPSDWYSYENTMLVFFAGRYIDPELYRIENHQIFLDPEFANSYMLTSQHVNRKYTIVYLAASIIEEYWEKIKPPIYSEPTPKRILPKDDPLDLSGYYFDIYESEYDINGYISYDPGFTAYSLIKEDFLLFGNSTFIHPLRYQFINNKSLRMIDEVDKKHSPFALYNMVIPFNKNAKDFYKEDYIKPKFQIVEIITTEKTNILEFPVLDGEYESVLMFRNSLILPIYDEDRFVIDDINHKFMIINEEDWIPANTRVTFIFMSSKTNTDSKLLLVQDSFKCIDYFTQIPNSVYRYPGQKFNKAKMLLYLNGTFVVPERYILHQNTIFLVDDDIDLNDDHTFTIVYLDEVHSTEYNMESNIIDRTYEDGIDDIIFEIEVVKPL